MTAPIEPQEWTRGDNGTSTATDVLTVCCNAYPVNRGGEHFMPECPECGCDQPEYKRVVRICGNCDQRLDERDAGHIDCRRCRIPCPPLKAGFDAHMAWVSEVGYDDGEGN